MNEHGSPDERRPVLAHCLGLLRGCGIGGVSGIAIGPIIGFVGFLSGEPSFDSEIGPLPVIWNLGVLGLICGVLLGGIIGSLVDFLRERDRPSLFALIGVFLIAAPAIVFVFLGFL